MRFHAAVLSAGSPVGLVGMRTPTHAEAPALPTLGLHRPDRPALLVPSGHDCPTTSGNIHHRRSGPHHGACVSVEHDSGHGDRVEAPGRSAHSLTLALHGHDGTPVGHAS